MDKLNLKSKPGGANKKLKKFFEKGASLSSRFKSLVSYIEKATEEELGKFFEDNFHVIYGVFTDTFSSYENQCKRGRHDAGVLKDLLTVLRCVLELMTDLLGKGWQNRSIATVLEKVLYIENKHSFRKTAFELLMKFLQEVRQTDLVGAAINLTPLTAKYNFGINLMALPLSAPDKQGILLPSSGSVTIQESVELFEILLSFLAQSTATGPKSEEVFLFWWDLLKQQYLCVFYPTIWPEKTGPGKIGFPKCPEEIQSVLITCLQSLIKEKAILEVMFKGDEDKRLILEIFRQSISLHVNFDDTIKKSIAVFKATYLDSPPAILTAEELAEYRAVFIKDLAVILTSKSSWDSGEAAKKHEVLCLDVIELFKTIAVENSKSIDDATKEVLYFTLLDTASEVLSQNTSNPHLADSLHGVFIDAILFIWILTGTRNPTHWERLCSTMAGLFHTMETVTQVSNKIMQLTMVVQDKIYYIKTEKKKKTAKRPGMMGGDQSAKHMEPKSPDSVTCPSLPNRDEAISKIDWSVDEILFIWRNMLQIFGTLNSIRNPTIHVACVQQLWKVIDSIMWSETKVPYQETLDPDRPDFLCLIDIFGHLLFSACELPDAFVEGRAEAYKILCCMFCRDHIRPLPLKLLSHFYGILQEGLLNRDSKNIVQDSIIINSSNIFNLALPGANTLIPHYLGEIRRILTGEGRANHVKERAVIILTSLICLSSHLNGAEIPVPGEKKASSSNSSSSNSKESNIHDFLRIAGASGSGGNRGGGSSVAVVHPFPFSCLLEEVLSIMTDALKLEMMDSEIKVRLIWGVCVSLFEIVFNQSAANLVVSGLVLMLLKHLSGQSKVVIRAAVHAVTCLASVADRFPAVDPTTIIESVSGNIVKEISEYRANKSYPIDESLVADQLYCLLEWLLVVGDTVANDVKLIGKVSESLESALTGVIKNDSQRKPGSKRKSERPGTLLTEVPFEEIYSQSINCTDPTMINLPQIREAAENVILHLLHFQHNVPGKEGIETLTSFVNHTDDVAEGEDAKSLHFVHNDSVLFSLVEIAKPDGSGRFSRLIMRDSIGKYAWDTDLLFDFDEMEPQKALPFQFTEQKPSKEHLHLGPAPPPLPPATELDPLMPPAHVNVYKEEVDQLDHLLHYLSHNYTDLLPESGLALHAPAVCMDSQKTMIEYTEAALVAQIEEDRLAMNKKQEDDPHCHEWQFPYPVPQEPEGPYHHCRMILSHFGFLSYENFGGLSLLGGENEKVIRSLNQLDLANGREMIKVGLIYLREGQENQMEVLRNDSSSRSEMFGEFVRAIGWPIDVQTHRAYLGGLDPKLTTGVTAPYYATSTYELIYHDLTSMPTTEDPQQIHKKRHVGNDNVHIVWSEHLRDYNPRTIVSEFNDAHIVIYPLPNGLYKIHVYQKENVELFGPLMHGMCVSKLLLPSLVRATCLMANKYVRYTHEGYVTPFAARKRVLNQIVERHKTQATYRELIGSIVP